MEIKPRKLWKTKEVVAKQNAAIKFAKKHGLKYLLIDINPDSNLIRKKFLNGDVIFTNRYINRFKKYAKIK